jgi:hypothetical protein
VGALSLLGTLVPIEHAIGLINDVVDEVEDTIDCS